VAMTVSGDQQRILAKADRLTIYSVRRIVTSAEALICCNSSSKRGTEAQT
jgi:hypothetical protein